MLYRTDNGLPTPPRTAPFGVSAEVLANHRYQLGLGARSRQTASVGQQHERESSSDLRVVGLQLVDDPSQAHGLWLSERA